MLGSKVSEKASSSLDGSKNYVLELPCLGVNVKRVLLISRDILWGSIFRLIEVQHVREKTVSPSVSWEYNE